MYGVDVLKSVILMLALSERVINVEEAVSLSRLEEEFQVNENFTVNKYMYTYIRVMCFV